MCVCVCVCVCVFGGWGRGGGGLICDRRPPTSSIGKLGGCLCMYVCRPMYVCNLLLFIFVN